LKKIFEKNNRKLKLHLGLRNIGQLSRKIIVEHLDIFNPFI